MSDLVDRLRALPWHEPAIAEAADEIERLRGDLEVMRLQRDATQSSRCPTCERLRAALRKIARHDNPDSIFEACAYDVRIAKAALKGAEE